MNFYAHKWQENGIDQYRFLHDHLLEVGKLSYKSVCQLDINNENLKKVALIIGSLHDFGKYTSYFQEYLVLGKKSKNKSHALISALYAAYCSRENGLPDEYVLYTYLSVKHHHGNLCNLDTDINNISPDRDYHDTLSTVKIQLEDIKQNLIYIKSDMRKIYTFASHHGIKLDHIDNFIVLGIEKFFCQLKHISKRNLQINNKLNLKYTDFTLLYSALIDNDKRNAASLKEFSRKDNFDSKLIDSFQAELRSKNQNKTIDNIRTELFNNVSSSISGIDIENDHIFTITAPTGAGKTIAGLRAAMFLRDQIYQRKKFLSRIIYAMPFTTLVDQNYEVLRSIFSSLPDFKGNSERYILKHHHLSVLSASINDEDIPIYLSLMLVEDWDSEIIFTTFVQVFDALAGWKNKNLKKYYRIYNSIIILDEIQSIEMEKWQDIKFLIEKYAREFNVHFIIMTATQPNIIEKPKELNKNINQMFTKLSRVQMIVDIEKREPKEIIEKYIKYNFSSVLFMFNTIQSSIDAYTYAKNLNSHYKLYYLSSNLIPNDRKKRYKQIINGIKNKDHICVISTQIFEAGIDISFDAVIRDIAPIDSLIQSSGRTNRNGESNTGKIYVVNCAPQDKANAYYCKLIYGKLHTEKTLNILSGREKIEENEYPELIEKYYSTNKINNTPQLKKAMEKLNFSGDNGEEYISNFNMIDKSKTISIFVGKNNKAEKLFAEYYSILQKKDEFNNDVMIKLKQKLYGYIISTFVNKIQNVNFSKVSDSFYVIHKNCLKNSYNSDTGLKYNDTGAIFR